MDISPADPVLGECERTDAGPDSRGAPENWLNSRPQQELCDRCARLDLRQVNSPCREAKGELIAHLGLWSEIAQDSSCPLCILFSLVRPSVEFKSHQKEEYVLCALPTGLIYRPDVDTFDADPVSMLGIVSRSVFESPWAHVVTDYENGYIFPFRSFNSENTEHTYERALGGTIAYDVVNS